MSKKGKKPGNAAKRNRARYKSEERLLRNKGKKARKYEKLQRKLEKEGKGIYSKKKKAATDEAVGKTKVGEN